MPKVLIVEDDLMIADMMEELLVDSGYGVCGIARTVAEAVALIRRHTPDLAVVDIRLADGELGTEIAPQLGNLGNLGILYASGNVSQVVLNGANGHACLTKPYRDTDLLRSLEIVSEIRAAGTATPPFPRGFQILPSAMNAANEVKRA